MADDDELSPIRDPFLKNFLKEELRRFGSKERKDELRSLIGIRESKLANDNELNRLFEGHLDTLPTAERPQSKPQEHRLFNEWEDTLKRELMEWREELAELEAQRLDKRLVYDNAKDRLLRLFEAEAREAGFLPQKHVPGKPSALCFAGRESVDRGAFIADVFDRIPRLRQVPLGHWPALAIRGVILSAPRLRWAPKSFAGS